MADDLLCHRSFFSCKDRTLHIYVKSINQCIAHFQITLLNKAFLLLAVCAYKFILFTLYAFFVVS